MGNFDFDYDFSRLSAVKLQETKINHFEIRSVFENNLSCAIPVEGFETYELYYSLIGFGSESRFLLLTLDVREDKVVFHKAKVADEQEIRKYYCG